MFQQDGKPTADANFKEHLSSKSVDELKAELDSIFEKEEKDGIKADPTLVAKYFAAIEKKEQNDEMPELPGSFEESWATFTKNHSNLFPKEKTKSRNYGSQVRRAFEIVVLAAALLAVSATATKWPDHVITWGKELLHIAPVEISSGILKLEEPNSDGYSTFSEAVIGIGVDDARSLSWIPERYVIQMIKVQKTSLHLSVAAVYTSNDSELMVRVTHYPELSSMPDMDFERDEDRAEIRKTQKGISYQLSENFGVLRITWEDGHNIYSISGEISKEEAERMVDSFYGG